MVRLSSVVVAAVAAVGLGLTRPQGREGLEHLVVVVAAVVEAPTLAWVERRRELLGLVVTAVTAGW